MARRSAGEQVNAGSKLSQFSSSALDNGQCPLRIPPIINEALRWLISLPGRKFLLGSVLAVGGSEFGIGSPPPPPSEIKVSRHELFREKSALIKDAVFALIKPSSIK